MQLNTDIPVEPLHYVTTLSLFTDFDLSYHNLFLALCSVSSAKMSFAALETHREMERRKILSQISDVLQIELKELLFLKDQICRTSFRLSLVSNL